MWAVVALMIIAALLLTSCGEPTPPTPGPYGGTLTSRRIGWQMKGFDPLVWDNNNMNSIIFDRFFTVPWEKGPAGTAELSYWRSTYYPIGLYVGEYLEDFERVDLYTVNYQLREGIPYWDKEPVNGRNMTVDDIMWNWLYNVFHPRAGTYLRADPAASLTFWTNYMGEIGGNITMHNRLVAHLDELRVVTPELEALWMFGDTLGTLQSHMETDYYESYDLLEGNGYDVSDLALLTSYYRKTGDYTFESKHCRGLQSLWSGLNGIWPTPPEITSVDEFTDWETVVATGPWIPQDFFPSSGATFIRNPDYWQNDPLNPENQLPYLDEWELLMIEDESAYYAALEAKQLDIGAVEWYKIGYFDTHYPEMEFSEGVNSWTHCIFVRNDILPFSDIRVRHAAMLAIDHDAILTHYEGYALKHCWPEQEWAIGCYTPFDELPTETQDLYGYDTVAAEALLADAGYPGGFATTMTVYQSSEDQESCLIVKDYLDAVGINVSIEVPDPATYGSILYGRNYEHMCSCWWGNDFPGDVMAWAEGGAANSPYNFGRVDDPIAYQLQQQLDLILDDTTRFALIKADNVRRLGNMYQILVPTPVGGTFWWPWLDYHGETDGGWPDESGWGEVPKYLSIDEEMKADMT